MNEVRFILASLLLLLSFSQPLFSQSNYVYQSENLAIHKITDKTFVHVSYLQTENFGKVACNGLIVVDGGEAVVADTPINDTVATELIRYIRDALDSEVKAVVITHFHEDCLGGLATFHEVSIPSYAYDSTLVLAKDNGGPVPKHSFGTSLSLSVGDEEVVCAFLGEGHTIDNSVCYVPSVQVLFGGCLVKSMGANKGNLADATWSLGPQRWRA